MRFHRFASQAERRAVGGSDFIELQHCLLPPGSPLRDIVDSVVPWRDDSLYVFGDDMEAFDRAYGDILTGGVYHNLRRGPMDLCGINYYARDQVGPMLAQLAQQRPPDGQTLSRWLQDGASCIGFYVLGL